MRIQGKVCYDEIHMNLFGGSKPTGYLGVDIGGSGIKVVELGQQKGRAVLWTYGYSESRVGGNATSPLDDPKATGTLLASVCKKAGVKSNSVVTALPTSSLFSTIVAIQKTKDPKAFQASIQSHVSKLTPIPIQEMIIYSTQIDGKDDKGKQGMAKEDKGNQKIAQDGFVRVLVTGAAKTLIQKYIEIFKTAKLELKAIDTESFALVHSLIGKDPSAILLVDIGSRRTNITIVEKGIPFVSRSINLGGESLTKRVMEQMHLSQEEAEQVKRDLMTTTNSSSGVGALPPVLEAFVQPLIHEIRFALQLYSTMELTEMKRVEKIIVTGGSAHLPQIPEYLASTLNINAYRGDPWARVLYPQDLRSVLEDVGPRLSVAIGLAMRDLE